MLTPIEGQPNLFRDTNTGRIIGLASFRPWETSDKFEGVKLVLPQLPREAILMSWSLSSAKPLQPVELQQLVTVTHFGCILGSALVKTALVEAVRFVNRAGELLLAGARTEVVLSESPIEGVGLRFHMHGYIRE